MEVHHPVFYVSLGHMQNSMRSSVTLKLKLTLTLNLTLTDTEGAVLTLMLGYRPDGELPSQTRNGVSVSFSFSGKLTLLTVGLLNLRTIDTEPCPDPNAIGYRS